MCTSRLAHFQSSIIYVVTSHCWLITTTWVCASNTFLPVPPKSNLIIMNGLTFSFHEHIFFPIWCHICIPNKNTIEKAELRESNILICVKCYTKKKFWEVGIAEKKNYLSHGRISSLLLVVFSWFCYVSPAPYNPPPPPPIGFLIFYLVKETSLHLCLLIV
jgi:hypothetical protein